MSGYFATLFFLISFAGCSHLTLYRGDEHPSQGETQDVPADSYLWGFANVSKIPPESELCPKSRIETIDMKMTGQDVLITMITLGIYVPHRVEITCR
jgi:hypothetical protein